MPFGRSSKSASSAGPKHVDTLTTEFEETHAKYVESLNVHAAETADRRAHVTNRLATLEAEAAKLQDLHERINAA
jgi:hypothetical protein